MKKLPLDQADAVPGGIVQPNPEDLPTTDYPQYPVFDGGCTNPPTK